MKHISILVPNGHNNLSSIVGAYKIFSRANAYWNTHGKTESYTIELVGIAAQVDFHDGLFNVKPHTFITNIAHTNLIIIPSLNHNYEEAILENKPILEWMENQFKNGAEIASICTGAFLLAATGLLNGKRCSTHWAFADTIKNLFPKVQVQADSLITDEGGICTNGGAYSFLNLIIYLVEKYYDRETAIYCSKVFQIEMDRHSQSAFSIFSGQKSHGDDMVLETQAYIEANLHEKISFEEVSSRFAVGRRSFDRRFIKATGNTPLEYAQRVKMEAAKKAFETSRKTVNEVMYEVGYSDVKAFREVFRKITAMSPLEYKSRFNKLIIR